MQRPHACRVFRVDTRRRARTPCRARARWAASAAWLGTPIWMVQARRARYAGLASIQAWARHRAFRVQRVDTTTTRRRCRRPRAHRACRAMWGTMHHRAPLCVRTALWDTTTTIGTHRHHVTVMRGSARQARTQVQRRAGARLVRLADTIMTRTQRQRAMRVHQAHTRVPRRRLAGPVHRGRRTQTPTHPQLVRTVLWVSTAAPGLWRARTAQWVRRMLTGHHRRPAQRAQRGSMVREALRHA